MLIWNLVKEMDQLHQEIDDVMRETGLARLLRTPAESERQAHYPQVNLSDDKDNLYVEALLPGVDPEQVEISLLGETLTLAGERSVADEADHQRRCHRSERRVGRFQRRIELPSEVNREKITAEAKHGLLRITLAKAASAQPRKIAINVG